MSSIIFQTSRKRIEVCGSERYCISNIITEISLPYLRTRLKKEGHLFYLETPEYLKDPHKRPEPLHDLVDIRNWLYTEPKLFPVKLNYVLELGNDILILAARIHGQCEIHGYIRAKNAKWVARILTRGLSTNHRHFKIFRENEWYEVVDLLRSTKETVVMSYSVCNDPIEDYKTEDWESMLSKLHKDKTLELRPAGWYNFHFNEVDVWAPTICETTRNYEV